jgi:hypothetical protein
MNGLSELERRNIVKKTLERCELKGNRIYFKPDDSLMVDPFEEYTSPESMLALWWCVCKYGENKTLYKKYLAWEV